MPPGEHRHLRRLCQLRLLRARGQRKLHPLRLQSAAHRLLPLLPVLPLRRLQLRRVLALPLRQRLRVLPVPRLGHGAESEGALRLRRPPLDGQRLLHGGLLAGRRARAQRVCAVRFVARGRASSASGGGAL